MQTLKDHFNNRVWVQRKRRQAERKRDGDVVVFLLSCSFFTELERQHKCNRDHSQGRPFAPG